MKQNGQRKFAGLLKQYKNLLAEGRRVEKAGVAYDNRTDDEGEFLYMAHRRAADSLYRMADRLIDSAANKIV